MVFRASLLMRPLVLALTGSDKTSTSVFARNCGSSSHLAGVHDGLQ